MEFWAYGGDFGDTPNDAQFCANGLVFPDRRCAFHDQPGISLDHTALLLLRTDCHEYTHAVVRAAKATIERITQADKCDASHVPCSHHPCLSEVKAVQSPINFEWADPAAVAGGGDAPLAVR